MRLLRDETAYAVVMRAVLRDTEDARIASEKAAEREARDPHLGAPPSSEPWTSSRSPWDGATEPGHIFLSHSRKDIDDVQRLCDEIVHGGGGAWVDWEQLRAGVELEEHIRAAIDGSSGVVVLLTPDSVTSDWVRKEVLYALEVAKGKGPDYSVVPVLDGVPREKLPEPFDALARRICVEWNEPDAMERVLEAFGLTPRPPLDELELRFEAPRLVEEDIDGVKRRRVHATVGIGDASGAFEAPIGLLEADDLRWYLERYYGWPAEEFEKRAEAIVEEIPRWGRALWEAVRGAVGTKALDDWLSRSTGKRRLLSLRAEAPDPDEKDDEAARGQAALLALPWELARDRKGFLFQRDPRVAIRRVLSEPGEGTATARPLLRPPIRVLVVVARPEKAGLIDPRATAPGLLDAAAPLGRAVEVDFLRPPTLEALSAALRAKRFHALHFDGHGVYDEHSGLGMLCFEHPDEEKRAEGEVHRVSGKELHEALGETRLPLAFLQACQSAEAGEDPGSAVATALLEAGAESVIAMSHSVLVETARRFTAALYTRLFDGRTIGDAVTGARYSLFVDRNRGRGGGELPLALTDWFVPVLLQRGADRALLPGGVRAHAEPGAAGLRAARVATLPEMEHDFVGRVRERLALERTFEPDKKHRIALVLGVGGQGKTTLADEAARWLVDTGRFPGGAAFVSLEFVPSMTAVVSTLGRAVAPDFVLKGDSDDDLAAGKAQILDALHDTPHLVVFDNFESLLPPPEDAPAAEQLTHEPALLAALLDLVAEVAGAGDSRAIVTCREPIDDPRLQPGNRTRVIKLAGLPTSDAVELVGHVCRLQGIRPRAADDRSLEELVQAVGGHPRSLVLLPPLLKNRGLGAVTEDLHGLMAELDRLHPDERQRSLYASLRLSLDRLPREERESLLPLGLLRVGVFDQVLGNLLGLDEPDRERLVAALEERALLHREGSYLRFHPALAPYLETELRATRSADKMAAVRERGVVAYVALVGFLYQMRFGPQGGLATSLTVRELPNLLRVLDHLAATAGDDTAQLGAAIEYATSLEGLLQSTPQQRALQGVAARRTALADKLDGTADGWSHSQFNAAGAALERLLGAGRLEEAVRAARATVDRGAAAARGGEPYPEAPYDRAVADLLLGRALRLTRRPEPALEAIERARAGFGGLANAGDGDAILMASACLTEGADCLTDMGRYDDAAGRYQAAIETKAPLGDERGAAVAKGQLATVRMLQGDLAAALGGFHEAKDAFEALNEPKMVAAAWHQIGMVLHGAKRHDDAEAAYKESLALEHALGNRLGAATTLSQLAIVAASAGRLEESVAWNRRALDVRVAEGDRGGEAASRSNLASRLHLLGRLDEAETQARQATELSEDLGIGTEPWKTWNILHAIATDRGDTAAASHARARAMDWYRRYRDQGGAPQTPGAQLIAQVAPALPGGAELAHQLDALAEKPDAPTWLPPLARALAHLLRGNPDAARDALPTLDYDDAVELERLLDGNWP